jgi:2-haloalkanoic acid dehalogenase type II
MRFDVVAFDLYGTLLDVSGLAKRLEAFAGADAARLLANWRKAQLERTWRETSYEPFDVVTARALEDVAPRLDASTRQRMCETWLSLPAFPDAGPALESLQRARLRRAILSNGTPAMIRAALAAADLDVDEVLSCDQVRVYKPRASVYGLLDKERSLFVSANGWDAEGAKRNGLTVAWIDRGTPAPALPPDFRVSSLAELAAIVWRDQGVRVVKGTELDPNTAQTAGMSRAAAITHARAGAEKLWAGTVTIHANAKTGAHHHGPVESVIYVVRGRARMRWGEKLEYTAEAGPGDFIYVPPYVPHQEINASREEPLDCVLVRSGQEPVVVNLDIAPAEPPEEVKWIDSLHRT